MGAAPPWHAVAAALIEGLQDAACVVDAAGHHVVAANSAAELLFGADRGQLHGSAVRELAAAPEDLLFWDDAQAEGLDSDTIVRSASGALRPVRRRISHARWPGAGAGCFLVQWQDRSAQRRAEAERAQQLAQLNATLEATADGILVTDAAGRIANFNRRFAALWALPVEAQFRGDDDAVHAWLQRRMADPAGYMRRLADIDEGAGASTRDILLLADGGRIERASQAQRCEGRVVGRVWSFRRLESDAAAAFASAQSAASKTHTGTTMVYKFKSKAAGDLIMLGPVGDQVLRVIGKSPSATGIIAAADMPAAMAAIEQAVAADDGAGKPRDAEADEKEGGAGVGLRQRAWPLLEMMKRAQAEDADIVWGV